MEVVWLVSRAKEASGGEKQECFLAGSNMICLKRRTSGSAAGKGVKHSQWRRVRIGLTTSVLKNVEF